MADTIRERASENTAELSLSGSDTSPELQCFGCPIRACFPRMQLSRSLADFMARLDEGPQGASDAFARIDQCVAAKSDTLDLQQMRLTDDDLLALSDKLSEVADHVTKLNLFMNEISTVPAMLGVLNKLKVLHVGANPLEAIEGELFQALPFLEELDIGYSELLEHLPDTFHHLKSLRVLLAGNGRLQKIPISLFACSSLEELYLYGNCLSYLSADIGKLRNLRVLNVGRNQIEHIPDSITQCCDLETLHIYENCLSGLPRGMNKLTRLVDLNIMSNEKMPALPVQVRNKANARDTAAYLGEISAGHL